MKRIKLLVLLITTAVALAAQSPFERYAGSDRPYPAPDKPHTTPARLTPVFINHLGRHGSRFPTSGQNLQYLIQTLEAAATQQKLTPAGEKLLADSQKLDTLFTGQWGELTPLGFNEQQEIARRMYRAYPQLFSGQATVEAIATSTNRCIASMDAFCVALQQQNPALRFILNYGHRYDPLLRFYDKSQPYLAYRESGPWKKIYQTFKNHHTPLQVAARYIAPGYHWQEHTPGDFVTALFQTTTILPCTGVPLTLKTYFTPDEARSLWETGNLRQYLLKSAAPVGRRLPVDIARPLLQNFIATTDSALNGEIKATVRLRFAHAETLIPFAACMHIRTADRQTAWPDSVAAGWQDYHIAPMAANIQWIIYRDPQGEAWVTFQLNEHPVQLNLDPDAPPYYKWKKVRAYLQKQLQEKQPLPTATPVASSSRPSNHNKP